MTPVCFLLRRDDSSVAPSAGTDEGSPWQRLVGAALPHGLVPRPCRIWSAKGPRPPLTPGSANAWPQHLGRLAVSTNPVAAFNHVARPREAGGLLAGPCPGSLWSRVQASSGLHPPPLPWGSPPRGRRRLVGLPFAEGTGVPRRYGTGPRGHTGRSTARCPHHPRDGRQVTVRTPLASACLSGCTGLPAAPAVDAARGTPSAWRETPSPQRQRRRRTAREMGRRAPFCPPCASLEARREVVPDEPARSIETTSLSIAGRCPLGCGRAYSAGRHVKFAPEHGSDSFWV